MAPLGPQSDASTANDPLSFRPRLEEVEEGADESVESDGEKGQDHIYRPPKISMKKFEGDQEKKKTREERLAEKATRSGMMKFIREEFGDEPELADAGGGALAKPSYEEETDSSEEERTKFEEEYMIRLPVTRKDKKKRAEKVRRLATLTNELHELEDFGDIARSNPSRPKKALGHFLNEIDNAKTSRNAKWVSADVDVITEKPARKEDHNKSKHSKKRDSLPSRGKQQKRFRTR